MKLIYGGAGCTKEELYLLKVGMTRLDFGELDAKSMALALNCSDHDRVCNGVRKMAMMWRTSLDWY